MADSAADRTSGGDAERATVLVVDDETIVRETLVDLLEAHGLDVLAVETGDEVFPLLQRTDLILLDVMMPGRDGWEICRMIKEREPFMPVVMVTARTSPQDVIRTFDAGADDYIAKPFNATELWARLNSRLRVRRAEQKLQEANAELRRLAEQNYELYRRAKEDADVRARLLRELDHRIRNNLSVIMGLVALERNRRPARSSSDLLASLDRRLRSFVLVHEAFRREGYHGVSAPYIVESVVGRLRAAANGDAQATVEVHSTPLLLTEKQAFAVALILNETVSNALHHAFPAGRAGAVTVELVRLGDQVELNVRDDGVGHEIGAHSGTGSGRSIVQALVRGELHGTLQESSGSAGTDIRVRFPVVEVEGSDGEGESGADPERGTGNQGEADAASGRQ